MIYTHIAAYNVGREATTTTTNNNKMIVYVMLV